MSFYIFRLELKSRKKQSTILSGGIMCTTHPPPRFLKSLKSKRRLNQSTKSNPKKKIALVLRLLRTRHFSQQQVVNYSAEEHTDHAVESSSVKLRLQKTIKLKNDPKLNEFVYFHFPNPIAIVHSVSTNAFWRIKLAETQLGHCILPADC